MVVLSDCCVAGSSRTVPVRLQSRSTQSPYWGSALVYARESGHGFLVRELALASEAHSSRSLSRLPYRENPLHDVNCPHFLLKVLLDRRRGFDRDDIAGWLCLFSVVVNPSSGAMAGSRPGDGLLENAQIQGVLRKGERR